MEEGSGGGVVCVNVCGHNATCVHKCAHKSRTAGWRGHVTGNADQRLVLRLTSAQKDDIREAATREAISVSRFVRRAALDAAASVLGEPRGYTRLGPEAYDGLVAALPAPAAASPILTRAVTRLDPESPGTELLCRERHRLESFECADEGLTEWLRWHSFGLPDGESCFVCCRTGFVDVTGYYTLAGHRILRSHSPALLHPGLPAVLLRRLSVQHFNEGNGLAAELLVDALQRALTTSEVDGSAFVVAEPHTDRGAGFLRHHGFQPVPGTDRLVQRMSDIAAALRPDGVRRADLPPLKGIEMCSPGPYGLILR